MSCDRCSSPPSLEKISRRLSNNCNQVICDGRKENHLCYGAHNSLKYSIYATIKLRVQEKDRKRYLISVLDQLRKFDQVSPGHKRYSSPSKGATHALESPGYIEFQVGAIPLPNILMQAIGGDTYFLSV